MAPLQPVEWPDGPWKQWSIDIVGPLDVPFVRYLITLADYYSKCPEVLGTNTISREDIIELLDLSLSCEGLPEVLVTDNGPQFVSQQFENYLKEKGIRHVLSSNYYPKYNGQIECLNSVLKVYIQVARLEGKDPAKSITEFLSSYRVTSHAVTGRSSAFLLHGRPPRSKIDISKFRIRPQVSGLQADLLQVRIRVSEKQ